MAQLFVTILENICFGITLDKVYLSSGFALSNVSVGEAMRKCIRWLVHSCKIFLQGGATGCGTDRERTHIQWLHVTRRFLSVPVP